MPIIEELDKAGFDALPETQRALYAPTEDGAKYKLDIVPASVAKGAADISKKQADAASKQAADRLAAFSDIDPDEARAAIKAKRDAEAAALAAKDTDGSIRAAKAEAKAAKERADAEAAAKVNDAKKGFDARLIALEVKALAVNAGVLPDAIDDVIALAKSQGFASDEDGELVGPKGATPATWLKDYLAKKSYLVGKSEGGDTPPKNGRAPQAGLKKSNMTAKQKGEYIDKHGAQAFRNLPQ